jgi:hypothetical protein
MISRAARLACVFCLGASIFYGTASGARADVVTDWNETAATATEVAGAPVPVQMRMMAIVHAAVFDAVNAIERKYDSYAVEIAAAPGASPEAAAAAAAHGVLERLYPPQKAMFDGALARSLKEIADGPAKTEGLRVGREVAEKLFALRKEDGSAIPASYVFGKGAGVYQATPPMNMKPILPHWGNVKPFVLATAKQFSMPGPPPVDSAAFAKDFDEVRRLGSKNSTERTSEQTAIAIHWAGSEVPPLNAVARGVSSAKKLNLIDNARFFALFTMAMADSLIAGFDNKYRYNFWRPVTAIRAGLMNNRALSADPKWEPLIVTPPHPDYPSGHCLGAGAAVAVLQANQRERCVLGQLCLPAVGRPTPLGELFADSQGGGRRPRVGRHPLPHCRRARHAAGTPARRVRPPDTPAAEVPLTTDPRNRRGRCEPVNANQQG